MVYGSNRGLMHTRQVMRVRISSRLVSRVRKSPTEPFVSERRPSEVRAMFPVSAGGLVEEEADVQESILRCPWPCFVFGIWTMS